MALPSWVQNANPRVQNDLLRQYLNYSPEIGGGFADIDWQNTFGGQSPFDFSFLPGHEQFFQQSAPDEGGRTERRLTDPQGLYDALQSSGYRVMGANDGGRNISAGWIEGPDGAPQQYYEGSNADPNFQAGMAALAAALGTIGFTHPGMAAGSVGTGAASGAGGITATTGIANPGIVSVAPGGLAGVPASTAAAGMGVPSLVSGTVGGGIAAALPEAASVAGSGLGSGAAAPSAGGITPGVASNAGITATLPPPTGLATTGLGAAGLGAAGAAGAGAAGSAAANAAGSAAGSGIGNAISSGLSSLVGDNWQRFILPALAGLASYNDAKRPQLQGYGGGIQAKTPTRTITQSRHGPVAQTSFAAGGIAGTPRYLDNHHDGMADTLPAHIDGQQPAALSGGEFVIPADVVSHLGNGNSQAGAKQLFDMMDRIRQARTGTTEQGAQINPKRFTPV